MRNCYPSNQCATPYMQQANNSSQAVYDCPCYLAIANVPWQHFTNYYDPEKAFMTGTIFPELDKPFLGRSVKQ